jgi:2-polyprenyl-3-methyl-5-hydroxy-6-metoxy-1,4-benzoquinol methylase
MKTNTLMELLKKIKGKIASWTKGSYNVREHPAEKYYYQLYMHYLSLYLTGKKKILEVGCQHGRFTIPLVNAGHSLTATDIKSNYEASIHRHLSADAHFSFRCESITTTLKQFDFSTIDVVMCLELLYTFSDYASMLQTFAKKMPAESLFIGSHRSIGYYASRYIKEKKHNDLQAILDQKHLAFNAQTTSELKSVYENAGFRLLLIKPIGLFSGFGNDPFTALADTEHLSTPQLEQLKQWEFNDRLQELAKNNARYLLVVAQPTHG